VGGCAWAELGVSAGGPTRGRGDPKREGWGRAGSSDGARRSRKLARAGRGACWRSRIARRRGRGERRRTLNAEDTEQLQIGVISGPNYGLTAC
jgi:hypothetical protein